MKMQIKILWLSYYPEVPRQEYWDMTMIKDMFSREMWNPVNAFEFVHCTDFSEIEKNEGAIIVIPARYHHKDADRINTDIAEMPWVVLMVVGDEESVFPVEKISHPNIRLWLMHPIPGQHKADHFLICGYTPDTRSMLGKYPPDKARDLDWIFAGQVTHQRRKQCVTNLRLHPNGFLHQSPGFAQGLSHEEYYDKMSSAKIAPCPSGPATPDSFRFAEALEAGCLPIVDDRTIKEEYPRGYWQNVFQCAFPFPVIHDWGSAPGYIGEMVKQWPQNLNNAMSWWMNYKRDLVYALEQDLLDLGNACTESTDINDLVSIVIPTSPIPSHPNLNIIEETVASIRHWLSRAEIFIMCDGVRDRQKHYQDSYAEYVRRLIWKCNHHWSNVLPIVFEKHTHQAAMTRETMKRLKTPLMMFVEHDTPIVTSRDIDFNGIARVLLAGDADMVRFHYDVNINQAHQHLMLDAEPVQLQGVPMVRTFQWSQRPHLATVSFYKRILENHFTEDARTMIEDRMYGIVEQNYRLNPQTGWYQYRLVIYAPPENMLRSLHTCGRENDPKFEDEFKY